ncbi:hypothetical protein [Halobacteriaceae bacterium SHR40]|uniref:hypothetical protein n=1 Tax=Halovenus amylolytica TaxID=2500550 RepID=UPI000FE32686
MSDTIDTDTLIDDLVEAIDDEDANRTRNLIGAIGDRYDELSADEEKRIRQATILRGNGGLSEDEEEQLGQLVSTAANTEMKRGAFLIRAVAAVRELEQDSTPQDDFEQAVTEVKDADENLETELNNSTPVIEGSDIPPSVEIVNLSLEPATVAPDQTSQMVVTIANVGDEPADDIELSLDPSEGVSVSEPQETIGTIGSDEDRTRTFEVEGKTLGEQRIRVELTSANAGSDIDSRSLTVEETDEPDVGEYTDQDGVIDTDGLRNAVADWQAGDIDTDLLREVVTAWQSGDPIE